MATRISNLPVQTLQGMSANDVLPITDVETNVTKKVSAAVLTEYLIANGAIGYSGSVGIGYIGSSIKGYTGSTIVGYVGSTIVNGYTGSSSNGYVGSIGSFGYTGSSSNGYVGSVGFLGYTGSAGTGGGGGNPFDQDLNTTNPVTFASLTVGDIVQSNCYLRTTNSPGVSSGPGVIVWSSVVNYISSAKLLLQVECNELGDATGWHSQSCEAIIACRGYASGYGGPGGDPSMTVYGVTHTSVDPLVTYSVQRNPVTKLVEVIATLTLTASGTAYIKIHSTEMATRD